MSRAIVVSTALGMEPWLDQCLKSLQPVRGIPVIIFRNTLGTGEAESLRQAALYTQYDEVIFLHDTMELLDPGLVDYCFTGSLMADCYAGYGSVETKSDGRIIRAACVAHARRKVFEA